MRTARLARHSMVVWLLVLLQIITPGTIVRAQKSAAAPASVKEGWPRQYSASDGARLTLYEPQIASWDDQKLLTLHAALSYQPSGSAKPVLGTFIAEADTRVSVAERLVDFSSFRVTQSNFPEVSKDDSAKILAALKSAIPIGERVIALDRVLASLDSSQIRPKNVDGLRADPPAIHVSTTPALIVNIDGDVVWSPIASNDLRYAINTNWDLFEYARTHTFYLRDGVRWLKASELLGPWTAAGTVPASFSKLPADENWKEVKAALPGQVYASGTPKVIVSISPAELILLKGQALYEKVPGTSLLWVRNTESDLFRMGLNGPVYYLVAGRWFSSPGFSGPWTFATLTLPDDFKRIPLEHERSRVLAAVPGTTQAAEGVLLAQIPQTARVSKKEVQAPDVFYQGEPQFQPIDKTTVSRAVNTDKDIIKVGDLYYLCFQGVWFVSRSANGPWEVTGSVPSQIYEIPVSSPSHSVTYVTVEDDDDDWVVYASAAAYTGLMIGWGCAVWGSGYYYPPYVGYGGYGPVYFPHYPTYGYGASYNPWTGTYGRGVAAYGPYGGAGVGARYNPRTGTYARGAAAYGPSGARGVAGAYNPRTGAYGATRQASGVYGSWGSTGVVRGDDWARTSRVTNNVTGTTTRATRTNEGGSAVTRRGSEGTGFAGQTGSGDVYAGRDGNVYRREGDSWQKYENGGWTGAQRPDTTTQRAQADPTPRTDTPTMSQLDRDAGARSDGAQRVRDSSAGQSSTTTRSGSYRPSGGSSRAGGASRGGGGRRR